MNYLFPSNSRMKSTQNNESVELLVYLFRGSDKTLRKINNTPYQLLYT